MQLLVCALVVALTPTSGLTLDQALDALRGERPVAGKVSREVSLEAVGRIARPRSRLSKAQLVKLIAVARAGAAERALAHTMVAHIASHGVTHGVALTTLTSAPSSALEEALQRPPRPFTEKLHRLVQAPEGDERLVEEALWLLSPGLDPKQAVVWLEGWFAEKGQLGRARALLREAGRTATPLRLLPVLALLQAPAELRGALGATLSVLVLRDEATAALALELAAEPEVSPELLRSLGSVPSWLRAKAKEVLLEHVRGAHESLASEEGAAASLAAEHAERAAAAIAAGAELLVQDLGELLPLLARRGPLELRKTAIRAMPSILYRDQATLGLLIRLLRDEAVAAAAHASLLRKSGARLPRQPELWERWLRGQLLEERESGEARATRLEAAWKLVAILNKRRGALLQRHARWTRTARRPAPPPRAAAGKQAKKRPLAADRFLRFERERLERLSRGELVAPAAPRVRWLVWTAVGLAGLSILLLWRWRVGVGGEATVRVLDMEPQLHADPDLALIPTSRWARRLQQMKAERRRASNTALVLAKAEEAGLLEEFLAGLERLRQAEQQDARERRAVAHVAFSTASFSRAKLAAVRSDATVPVSVLFPEERVGTVAVGELFEDPEPTPRDETVPVAELFPDSGGAPEEPNTGTAAVGDLFPEPAAACPREGTTVKVADLFPTEEEVSETVPVQELFSEARPAEEPPGSSDTVVVDDLFDRSAEGPRE